MPIIFCVLFFGNNSVKIICLFLRRLFGSNERVDNLRIVITRHGECADLALEKQWVSEMQKHGGYDPRIPHLTPRAHFREWNFDSPLTVDEENQRASVDRKLLDLGFPIDYCYSSPAFLSTNTNNK
ncbi:unnamed protein product [Rotaria socialis]|uniref:Phosphoglycerate mutase n=1 Tax=Rotaria socialis TaxID=392032 RepID=A0A821XE77_9BILA|nr:unnamed protein product [Rotaria socialis]CAF3232397.1 unnamed protein product [Rotaria socialis]CAF3606018.1 unnamed protein product [Rotaria socialis]CAF4131492.1 unnamed protein product [Rotaria socialis]CAF4937166.1 unnamed protein product [Rotaria socialis]